MRKVAVRRPGRLRTIAFVLLFLGLLGATAFAAPSLGDASVDASREAEAGDAAPNVADANATELDTEAFAAKAKLIAAFLDGKLGPDTSLRSLFDVDIDDPSAVAVEAVRLRALTQELDRLDADNRKGSLAARKTPEKDAGAVSPTLLQARLAVDRAQLEFYARTTDERRALVSAHALRQAAQLESKVQAETEAHRGAREAEEARVRALEAARNADTEAERLVSEEYARLLGIGVQQRAFAARMEQLRADMVQRRERTLKWQRRTRDLREVAAQRGDDEVDATYDELRASLRASRAELDAELDAAPIAVPRAGDSPLRELHLETEPIRVQRSTIDAEADRLTTAKSVLDEENLALLMEQTDTLNRERLLLFPYLSKEKRAAITGFSAAGRNQAAAEAFQLSLILRYHKRIAAHAIRNPRVEADAIGATVTRSALVLLQWFAAAVIFLWWRRRAKGVLEGVLVRMRESDRQLKLTVPSWGVSTMAFVIQIRSPLEWLGLSVAMHTALPNAIQGLLEVEVLFVIFTWTFASSAIVESVDTLATAGPFARFGATSPESKGLRHRSLRLLGRVVAVYGVTLALCSRLVGEGAIYEMVRATGGFAFLPVCIVLVHWWRPSVFARLSLVRKPSHLERWLIEHRRGWLSFAAAAAGGIYLFVVGTVRSARAWLGRFEISRRTTAYLFRRRLDKIGEEQEQIALGAIPDDVYARLGPTYARERGGGARISSATEPRVDALMARIRSRKGGLVALVGERGMGKSCLLQRIRSEQPESTMFVDTPSEGMAALRALLARGVGREVDTSLEDLARELAPRNFDAMMLDNFQRFAQPVMGGMKAFDEVMSVAGRHARTTTWVLPSTA